MKARINGHLAWDFIQHFWDQAQELFPINTIVRMVGTVQFLNTPDAANTVQSFFREHDIAQSAKGLQQILERQRVNTALRSREESRLSAQL